MTTIITRSGKGAALTHTEVDANFTNLNADKAEVSAVILATQKGAASGVAPLDATSKISSTYLPSYVDDVLEYANYAALPATGETGKIYVALDTNKTYRWSGSAYVYITSGAVDSVAGKTGVVTLVKADVGLSNVDNTTDALKPISTATQTALDLKAPLASPTFTGTTTAANLAYTGTLTGSTGILNIGSGQIYKDASGNVGIGVTPPSSNLFGSLYGPNSFLIGSGGPNFHILSNAYYNSGYKYAASGEATWYKQQTGQHIWYNAPSGTAGNAITFTQAMTLDASGNVGIGTSTPGMTLEIESQTPATNTINVVNVLGLTRPVTSGVKFGNAANFTLGSFGTSIQSQSRLGINLADGNSSTPNTEIMTLLSSGNVGIGTSSPAEKLQVDGGNAYLSSGQFKTNRANAAGVTTSGLVLQIDGGTHAQIVTPASGTMAMYTAGVEAMRITSTQDVSIPAGQLNITNANNTATGGGQIYLNGATGNRIDFSTNGVAAPAFTTRSVGTKIVLYPNISASLSDFALGMESNALWTSVPATTAVFKWYGGTTLAATLLGTGDLNLVGNMGVGGATASTSGSGITFPATPSASSDANTLDDYKEGVWTPVLTSGFTTTGTVTRAGYYTKVGRVVTVNFLIQATSVSPANAAVMSGLPFPATQYGIGLSTNVGGTATAMSITVSGSTLIFGGVSIFTPNLIGSITYIAS